MTSLDDFLKTGRLGPIACDVAMDDVRALLGEPGMVSEQKHPRIWKYGALELGFYNLPDTDRPYVISISIHFHDPEAGLPPPLAMSGWLPNDTTTYDEFRRHVEQSGIRVFGGVASGPRQHLVLESSVRVSFDEGALYSIGLTSKREPEFRQLTVRLKSRDLDYISDLAKARRISPAELCAEWIRAQVQDRAHTVTS